MWTATVPCLDHGVRQPHVKARATDPDQGRGSSWTEDALVTGGSVAFQSLKGDNGERKADMRAMDNKLDRVLEALPAANPAVG